jgi:hypothetical protein
MKNMQSGYIWLVNIIEVRETEYDISISQVDNQCIY